MHCDRGEGIFSFKTADNDKDHMNEGAFLVCLVSYFRA